MKTSAWVWIIVLVLAVAGGWYWIQKATVPSAAPGQPSAALGIQGSGNQTNTGQQSVTPVVRIAHDATLGDYLVAANGMTLYRYTKDTVGVSNCSGTCAANWPPYTHTVAEPLVAGDGVTGILATLTRADGSQQITYKGMPLYFWKGDLKAGDTTGHGVNNVWFVVTP